MAMLLPVPSEGDDDDLDSPSKRPQRSLEAPLTAAEMREMLSGHLSEMKLAWGAFQNRIDKVEAEQSKNNFEVTNLQSRTRVVEKDLISQRKTTEQNAAAIDNLAQEVQGMKVRLDEFQSKEASRPSGAPPVPPPQQSDPWGDFLRLRDQAQARPSEGHGVNHGSGEPDRGDTLTDDEKRTLVVGGWLQDTRRAVIEEESLILFQHEDIKPLLDSDKIAVYGPRRSVGMLKFNQRPGEGFNEVKERMWKVVKAVAALEHVLPSSRLAGEGKTMWTSFVKTRNARARSTHVSLIRRVAVALAKDSSNHPGGIGGTSNGVDLLSYDCDWNLGTIWLGSEKLGSATHRQPREGEIITMGAGWISLTAIARAVGCSTDEAKSAFEKEL